ncbi:MAG: SAM-dependent methyltransferase [Jiangellaceae bacterium]
MSRWQEWHVDYDDPRSTLARRLHVVRKLLGRALDTTPPGPVQLLSLCAGQARDVLGVVPNHPRRDDVRGRLVELDPANAAVARDGLQDAGLDEIDVVVADAGTTDSACGVVPADVVLLCGIFGNIAESDIERTIRAAPMLCAGGATVLWTRHRRQPDLIASIVDWFAAAGFVEVEVVKLAASLSTVGSHRLAVPPQAFEPGRRLFSFIR